MHKERPRFLEDEHKLVSLDHRDLEDLRRLIAKLDPAARRGLTTGLAPVRADNDSDPLLQRARTILDNRRKRNAIFGPQMFSEPGWEMLLTLYADQAGTRHSQASLSQVSGSRSTGMRWIDYLLDQKLILSEDHPTDRRRKFVQLSEKGLELLEVYLSETGCC